jgi:hypothetical protein
VVWRIVVVVVVARIKSHELIIVYLLYPLLHYSMNLETAADPVTETVPVYLSTHLSPYLHTVSHLPPDRDRLKLRLKPTHGTLFLHSPSSSGRVDRARAAEFAKAAGASTHPLAFDMGSEKAVVGGVEAVLDRFVLVRTGDGRAVLSPIAGHVDLRPSLLGVDLLSVATTSTSGAIKKTETDQPVLPTFQKRETEEQQLARLSSYDHLHRVWEEEQWTAGSFYPAETEEARGIVSRMLDGDCSTGGGSTGDGSTGGTAHLPTHSTSTFLRNFGIVKADTEQCEE